MRKTNKKNKETLIKRYKEILIESQYDEEYLRLEQEYINNHKNINLDKERVKHIGYLKSIYQHYLKDKKNCLKNIKDGDTISESLQIRIAEDNRRIEELSILIIQVANAHYRKKEREKLEKSLRIEEIVLLKEEILEGQNRLH